MASLLDTVRAKLGLTNDGRSNDSIDTLRQLFAEREATVDLTAAYHSPEPNMNDEPTTVFPYTLYDSNDDEYGTGAKEFPLPDDGLNDADAAVTEFVARRHDLDPEEVTFDDLAAVEGTTADAHFATNGDIIVTNGGDE